MPELRGLNGGKVKSKANHDVQNVKVEAEKDKGKLIKGRIAP